MPDVSMPDIPSPSLPSVGDIDIPSMGDLQGAIPDIGHQVDPLLNAGNYLRNQLARGGSDVMGAINSASVGGVNIPSINETIGFADSLTGIDETIGGFTGPSPTTPSPTTQKVDKSDNSLNPSVSQEFAIEVNERSDAQEVRKQIEKVSEINAVEGIIGALKSENDD